MIRLLFTNENKHFAGIWYPAAKRTGLLRKNAATPGSPARGMFNDAELEIQQLLHSKYPTQGITGLLRFKLILGTVEIRIIFRAKQNYTK